MVFQRFIPFLAASACAAALHGEVSVQLLSPRAGDILEGGSETTLSWTAASLPDEVEEWEAFLSLDAGRYYSVRITPHLEAGRRSFRWRVPNVGASDARILIRIGDENEEEAIALPQSFRIVPRTGSLDIPLQSSESEEEGEAALPMSPPVAEWVSGDREGNDQRTLHHDCFVVIHADSMIGNEASAGTAHPSSEPPLHPPAATSAKLPRSLTLPRSFTPGVPRHLLLQTMRLNI